MLYSIAEIAIYLNQATIRIRKDKGKIEFLTGTTTTIDYNAGQSQETQCLLVGTSSLWIANNDDGDSDTQKNFLDRIGIIRYPDLVDHVDNFGNKVIPTHGNEYNVGGGTSAQMKLFHNIQMRHGILPQAPDFVIASAPVNNVTYKLSSSSAPPADASILFVKGDYEGDGGAKMHAEQKLLAALGRHLRATGFRGSVNVAGVKMPCSTCNQVLADVDGVLKEVFGVTLRYRNAYLDEFRKAVNLNAYSASGVCSLDIGTYFT